MDFTSQVIRCPLKGVFNKDTFVSSIRWPLYTLNNYGSKPPVSTGILSQLPSSCLSIHQAPAKLENEIVSHGAN